MYFQVRKIWENGLADGLNIVYIYSNEYVLFDLVSVDFQRTRPIILINITGKCGVTWFKNTFDIWTTNNLLKYDYVFGCRIELSDAFLRPSVFM